MHPPGHPSRPPHSLHSLKTSGSLLPLQHFSFLGDFNVHEAGSYTLPLSSRLPLLLILPLLHTLPLLYPALLSPIHVPPPRWVSNVPLLDTPIFLTHSFSHQDSDNSPTPQNLQSTDRPPSRIHHQLWALSPLLAQLSVIGHHCHHSFTYLSLLSLHCPHPEAPQSWLNNPFLTLYLYRHGWNQLEEATAMLHK